MHDTFQGGITAMQGGKFKNGFAAGALSSLAASAFAFDGNLMDDTTLGWANSVRSSGAGMIAFGTISGGAGAKLSGGYFWQGAVTGLIVSGLNHAMKHGVFTKKYKLHVMHDNEAANGAGHQAIAGEIDGKLMYVSKDGTNENAGVFGEAKSTIKIFNSLKEIDDYYSTVTSPGKHYDSILTYKVTKNQLNIAMNTAVRLVKQEYNLFINSCTTIVQVSLINAGVIPNYNYSMIPNIAYKQMKEYLVVMNKLSKIKSFSEKF